MAPIIVAMPLVSSLLLAHLLTAGPGLDANDWLATVRSAEIRTSSGHGEQVSKKIHISFVPFAASFDGTKLQSELLSGWNILTSITAKTAGSRDFTTRFECSTDQSRPASVSMGFRFDDWSKDNYVFIPGAAYNGNRFRCLPVEYAPVFPPEDRRPDVPLTITDVPRLNLNQGTSQIELLSSSTTCPAVGIYMPKRKKAILFLFPDRSGLGQTGITIQESFDRKEAVLVLSAPGIRRLQYSGMHLNPSSDKGAMFLAGEKVEMKCRVYEFEAKGPTDLLETFMRHRKEMVENNHQRQTTPYSVALKDEIDLQNDLRWFELGGYFKNGNGDSPFGHIQLGWVGGLMSTYPILKQGSEPGRSRALTSINTTLMRLAAPSGFLYGMYKNGTLYGDNFDDNLKKPEIAMVRKNGDGLYYLLKQMAILPKGDVRPEWTVSARKWADAFVVMWNRYHQFGQLVNVKTGDISVGGSTAGAIVPAALTLASKTLCDPKYLKVAEESVRMMCRRDLDKGYTTGGPGEILQCPDSESAFGLLESLTVLYQATGKREWLTEARKAAALCSSWVMAYDFPFPKRSELGRVDARSTGAVWASIQNKHAAPGICSASGDCLLTLYRATGDPIYLDLLQDIAHNILEFMSRKDRPIGTNRDGYVNERVNTSDWEGSGGVGAVGDSSVSWCEVAIMLTCTDLPGIYVDVSRHRIWNFDHIVAEWVGPKEVQLTNTTRLKARVRTVFEGKGITGFSVDLDLEPGASRSIQLPEK